MWNFCLCTKKLYMLIHELLPSFRVKRCYLFVYLFSARLPYASTSLGIHKSSSFSVDHCGLAEEGVPFSRPAVPHLAKLLLLCVSLFLFPPALLCSLPHQGGASCSCLTNSNWPYTHKFCSAAGKSSLSPFLYLEGIKPSFWICLRGCSIPRGKESIFVATVELKNFYLRPYGSR